MYEWTAVVFKCPGHHITYVPDKHGLFWGYDDSFAAQGLSWEQLTAKCMLGHLQPSLIFLERCSSGAEAPKPETPLAAPTPSPLAGSVEWTAPRSYTPPRVVYSPPSMNKHQQVRAICSLARPSWHDVTFSPSDPFSCPHTVATPTLVSASQCCMLI